MIGTFMQTNSTNWIPKELSWISFNERVLQEAQDPTVPLIERVTVPKAFGKGAK